jgi:ADP-ribose pyrophosphatase YjhB (NUDIX family)
MNWRRHDEMPTKLDEAAGGVVAARMGDRIHVVLISVARGIVPRWSLPKGHFQKKETREGAALREVREETGLEVELIAPLATINYWFVEKRVRYHKYVHYFLMRSVGGDLADHDDEVVEARWFAWDEAVAQLTYDNERGLLVTERDRIAAHFDGRREPRADVGGSER